MLVSIWSGRPRQWDLILLKKEHNVNIHIYIFILNDKSLGVGFRTNNLLTNPSLFM